MGRIVTKIRVENLGDILLSERGALPHEQVRGVETDALVDTGATFLCLSSQIISELGLAYFETRVATTAVGRVERRIYQNARLTVMGRRCTIDVMELGDGVPALLGYVPLELLDLKPDVQQRALIPNLGTNDKAVADLY